MQAKLAARTERLGNDQRIEYYRREGLDELVHVRQAFLADASQDEIDMADDLEEGWPRGDSGAFSIYNLHNQRPELGAAEQQRVDTYLAELNCVEKADQHVEKDEKPWKCLESWTNLSVTLFMLVIPVAIVSSLILGESATRDLLWVGVICLGAGLVVTIAGWAAEFVGLHPFRR